MKSTAHNRPIVLIVGPTAGGKTALSVQLSGSLPGGGECISADSMQIYTGMDIGTATPTMDERAGIPHHLLSITPPNTPYSVDDWCTAATAAIADIRGRGRWPVVVGGTNLYVQALLFGLLDGPSPDPVLRAELAALDPAELRAELEFTPMTSAARFGRWSTPAAQAGSSLQHRSNGRTHADQMSRSSGLTGPLRPSILESMPESTSGWKPGCYMR